MSVSVNDFWNRIANSGLADAAQCRVWAVAYAQSNGGPPISAKDLAKWMISSGQLTLFQAKNLLSGSSQRLVFERYSLTQPVDSPPLSRWFRAFDRELGQAASECLLYFLDAKQAGKTVGNRFTQARRIQSDHVQAYDLIATPTGERVLWSHLPAGKTLAQLLTQGRLPSERVTRIGKQLAAGLSTLHAADLTHGILHPQYVWISDHDDAILLRDPIVRPVSPLDAANVGCLDPIDTKGAGGLHPSALAAPEFSIPGKSPDKSTDLYALGCLLYLARFGQPPFSAAQPDAVIQLHASSIPEGLQRVQQGDRSDPLLRVIAHLMAKNRDARIASADVLFSIFEVVESDPQPAVATPAAPVLPPQQPVQPQQPAAAPETPQPAAAAPPTPQPASPPAAAAVPPPQTPPPQRSAPAAVPTPSQPAAADASVPPAVASPAAAAEPVVPVKPAAAAKPAQPAAAQPVAAQPVPTQPTAQPQPTATVASVPAAAQPQAGSAAPQAVAQAAPAAVGTTVAAPGRDETDGDKPKSKRPGGRVRKKKKKKKKAAAMVIGGVGFSMLTLLIAVLLMNNRGPRRDPEPDPVVLPSVAGSGASVASQTPRREPTQTPDAPTTSPGGTFEVSDDRYALWLPPDESQPPPLAMLPPGPQMIVVVRPADILGYNSGRKVLAALDTELADGVARLEKRIGVPLGEVERLTMAVEATSGSGIQAALSVELVDAKSLGSLRKAWGDPEAAELPENQTLFAGDSPTADAYYVAQQPPIDSMSIQHFAVGSIEQMKLVAEMGGGAIPLPRQFEQTWNHVRGDSQFTVVATPNFLFADGKSMLTDYAPSAIEGLKQMLIPDTSVAMLTMQFEPKWYGEIRLAPGGGTSAAVLTQRLKTQFADLALQAEAFLNRSTPHPSWRALALRLPRMLDAVDAQSRTGISDNQAVANFYLPSHAAPNVLLGSWLAMNTPAGTVSMAAAPASAKPWTVAEMLEKPIKVNFEQEPLHFAGSTVVDEVNNIRPKGSPELKVVIIGNDLQKMGITQNQQIRDFKADGVKLRDVLTQLVQRANIVKDLTDPADPKQALVWVIGPDPDAPANQVVLVTTRDGAKAAGYTLQPEFVIKE
ncbi:Protein kinase domain protein [Rosistilla carotiformis]|uniref:Protein kinase domain protein n=1 Tax=Rosistilla carotiformis TaxID=2528017 RepID=A0A518JVW0_9BACT|nr:hypothetical protein [Rosistilla carotiformis]QDV69679.1 Protein kinase domain protein [Rosistilla carotiformis]